MFVKSGDEFEHFVAKVLTGHGHHAEVTQASGDYGVDLILNGDIAVQVKFYGSVVGPTAIQEVVAGKAFYGCSEAWVVTNSSFTPAATALAEANGVRLIAGEELEWLVENPDNSADHGARYLAHLADIRAQKEAALEAYNARRRAQIQADEERRHAEAVASRIKELENEFGHHPVLLDIALEKGRSEAVRISTIAAWKLRLEAEISAGRKANANELERLQTAGRILADVGYYLPSPSTAISPPGQHQTQVNLEDLVPPKPPAGWYDDPAGVSQARWWDGERWTSEVHGAVG
jgi:hypothetical protein